MKAKKLVLAALMVAVMAFALCACGSSNVEGTYVVFESNGQNVDEALEQYKTQGVEMTAEQLCTITLSSDSKFTMTVMGTEMGSGTNEVSGENLKLTVGENAIDATLKDGEMSFSLNGTSMKLKKK